MKWLQHSQEVIHSTNIFEIGTKPNFARWQPLPLLPVSKGVLLLFIYIYLLTDRKGWSYFSPSHFSPGCINLLLDVALFMILSPSSIFSQPCLCIACIRCHVIPPPAFLSASASSSIPRLPSCEPLCPSVVFPPYQVTCQSPLDVFVFQHDDDDIFYFGLFPYFRVSDFSLIVIFSILLSIVLWVVISLILFKMFSCVPCFCPTGHLSYILFLMHIGNFWSQRIFFITFETTPSGLYSDHIFFSCMFIQHHRFTKVFVPIHLFNGFIFYLYGFIWQEVCHIFCFPRESWVQFFCFLSSNRLAVSEHLSLMKWWVLRHLQTSGLLIFSSIYN